MTTKSQVWRMCYDSEREEAIVSLLGAPDSTQAIRADGPEAAFGSGYVQIIRCRTRLLKRTGEVEAECVAGDSGQRHRFKVVSGRFYDCTCSWHQVMPTAIVLVKTENGQVLDFKDFSSENAIQEGYDFWKSLWEDILPDLLVRASCQRSFSDSFSGLVIVSDDALDSI